MRSLFGTRTMNFFVAYSGPCRSTFRGDGDHDSGIMPINFRDDGDHDSGVHADQKTVRSRNDDRLPRNYLDDGVSLRTRRAGHTRGSVISTGRWRTRQIAVRQVVHAKDQRSAQTAFTGSEATPDRPRLRHRAEHGIRLHQASRTRWPHVGRGRRLGRRSVAGGAGAPVATPASPKDLGRLPQPDYADVHAELPGVKWGKVEAQPSMLKGMFGNKRAYLMITNNALKDYCMYVGARDYGKHLDVSWFLTIEPGFFKSMFSAMLANGNITALSFSLDLFSNQDLRAYITSVHRGAVRKAAEQIVEDLGQDSTKCDWKSKGFLEVW
jgi:hypothetical protein